MKWAAIAVLFLTVVFALYVNAQVLADLRGRQEQMNARIETLEWGLAQMCIEMESRDE